MQKNSDLIETLEVSRFIAALMVVISHFMQFGLLPANYTFLDKFNGGGIAVTYFFVLSGFILTYNYKYLGDQLSIKKYYINRISRIFPVLILSVAFSGLLVSIFANFSNVNQKILIPKNFSSGLIAGLSQVTGLSAWLPFSSVQAVLNAPSWSVGCEIFFYLCFPWILRVIMKSTIWKVIFGISILALVTLLPLFLLTWGNQSNRASLLIDRFPLFHLLEFIVGIISCKIALSSPSRSRFHLKLALIGFCFTICIIYFENRYSFLILAPIYGMIIYILASRKPSGSANKYWKFLLLLGRSSYSLYLLHWTIGIGLISYSDNVLANLICIPLTILVSLFVYIYVESPARKKLIYFLDEKLLR
jgi:peptidoglycan/LPS O-acetylase OafA/YrhL